jgi:hypothetical protein
MTGGNVIKEDPRERNERKWQEATNKVIAANLVDNLEKLLDGKAAQYVCSDKYTTHEKIVITYNHQKK